MLRPSGVGSYADLAIALLDGIETPRHHRAASARGRPDVRGTGHRPPPSAGEGPPTRARGLFPGESRRRRTLEQGCAHAGAHGWDLPRPVRRRDSGEVTHPPAHRGGSLARSGDTTGHHSDGITAPMLDQWSQPSPNTEGQRLLSR
nr:NAD(P)H-binding protein [Streptomyces sp.]